MGKSERTLAATPETAAPVTEEVMNEEVFNVSTAPVPTTGDFEKATHRVNSDVTVRDIRRKSLGAQYAAEKKFTVMIAPMYEAYFGKRMHVSINGISVSVPCDGRPYMVPESFAALVQSRLRAVNEQQAKQKRFSDIGRNNETSPGELALY